MSNKVQFKYPALLEATEKKTGFTGVITSRCQMLNGCIQYAIQPKCAVDKTHEYPTATWLDEQTIQVTPADKEEIRPQVHEFQFTPGEEVKSMISGLRGIITEVILDSNGCERLVIKCKPNKLGLAEISSGFTCEFKKTSSGILPSLKKVVKEMAKPVKKATSGCAPRTVSWERF